MEHFDPHAATPDAWAVLHAFRRLRAAEDDPGEPILSDAEFEHVARRPWPFWQSQRLLATRDGMIAGSIVLTTRREGTPDYAGHAPHLTVWGGVRRDCRRQGVGTALTEAVLAFMRDNSKTVATFRTHVPDGHAFLSAAGAVRKQRQVQNRLPFAGLDWGELMGWEAAAPPSLSWEVHAGRVPMGRLAILAPAFTVLSQDEPIGELDTPPNRCDLQGYATWYEEADRSGGEHLLVMLMDGNEVAGMCEAEWDARFPGRVHQALTAVARSWRGRGVAKALKARMLRLVRERHPDITLMTTNNAVSNAPMLSINTRLGFVRHKETGTYQVGPDTLAAYLAGRPVSRTPQPGA